VLWRNMSFVASRGMYDGSICADFLTRVEVGLYVLRRIWNTDIPKPLTCSTYRSY
jgi:hypothetical protein